MEIPYFVNRRIFSNVENSRLSRIASGYLGKKLCQSLLSPSQHFGNLDKKPQKDGADRSFANTPLADYRYFRTMYCRHEDNLSPLPAAPRCEFKPRYKAAS